MTRVGVDGVQADAAGRPAGQELADQHGGRRRPAELDGQLHGRSRVPGPPEGLHDGQLAGPQPGQRDARAPGQDPLAAVGPGHVRGADLAAGTRAVDAQGDAGDVADGAGQPVRVQALDPGPRAARAGAQGTAVKNS
jgi:hypothetical protein